jgi:hypothetical protein
MRVSVSILSFASGVLLHLLLFSRSEWDRHAPRIFLSFCLVALGVFASLNLGWGYHLMAAFGVTSVLGCYLLAGLFVSMLTYRLFFHPLRSFGGPTGARVSAFWYTKQNVPNMTFYRKLPQLHDQYGDFVRIRKLLSTTDRAQMFADQDFRSTRAINSSPRCHCGRSWIKEPNSERRILRTQLSAKQSTDDKRCDVPQNATQILGQGISCQRSVWVLG